MNWKRIYNILLFVTALIIWALMVLAKFAKYDSNYSYAIFALLISLFVTFSIFM